MLAKEAVTSLIQYLNDRVPFTVTSSMLEDENPRPGVVVEEWEKTHTNLHNTASRGYTNDTEEFHHQYTMRIDLKGTARDEEAAYDTMGMVEAHLLYLDENPRELHEDIREFNYGESRGVTSHHDLEPSEGSVASFIELKSFVRTNRDVESIEQFDTTYDIS